MALAQLAADVQAQAAGPALGREEGLEQVALHRGFQRRAIAPDLQVHLPGQRLRRHAN
jgi:hypothetical protein